MEYQRTPSMEIYVGTFAIMSIFIEVVTSIISYIFKLNSKALDFYLCAAASAYIVSYLFVRKYSRSFNSKEYIKILVGSVFVLYILLIIFFILASTGRVHVNYNLYDIPARIVIFSIFKLICAIVSLAVLLSFMYSSIVTGYLGKNIVSRE
jgi:hypothetical protein